MKKYIQQPVGKAELQSLVAIAENEERAFFLRNPHLTGVYRDRLLAVALCQGAALQYLRRGYGVNDFDIHFFYAQNPAKPRLSRAVKRIFATVGVFKNISVDFIRTVVPTNSPDSKRSVVDRIRAFLQDCPTANAAHLSKKAVIGLLPNRFFANVIWPMGKSSLAQSGMVTPDITGRPK